MRAAASKINEGSSNELAIYLDCNQIKAEFDSLVENLLKTRLKKDEIKKSEYKLIGQLACMIAVASFFDALTKAESRQFQASERLAKMVGSNFFLDCCIMLENENNTQKNLCMRTEMLANG